MRRLLFLLLFATSLFAQSGGQPVNIPVSGNWQLGAGSAVSTLPDGTNVISFGYNSSFSQDLGVAPRTIQKSSIDYGYYKAVDGLYALTFTIENGLSSYPGGFWEVEMDFGTQKLCDNYIWAVAAFSTITLVCPGPEYIVDAQALPYGGPVQGSYNLVITFSNPGWTLLLKKDNVSLTFTPTN